MKTIKVQGGLGNQLFCLAFAHSVARLSNEPTAIDVAAYGSDRYGHSFVLEDLALEASGLRVARRPLLAARVTTALMRAVPLPGYVSERAPPYDESAFAALIAAGRYFNGYWQHEAYMARPEEFAALAREAVFRRAGPRRSSDVVLHYRTYKEEIRARARRTPGPDYVRAALARIEAALGRPAGVTLISDDPAEALRTLGSLGREITVAAGQGPWNDMAMLMTAQAAILTNSSFSWWGGFCGTAEVVVYPRRDGFFHYPIPAARFMVV